MPQSNAPALRQHGGTPSRPSFPRHTASRIAATFAPYRPVVLTDSDPDVDEALRRARAARSNWAICDVCNGSLGPGHVCPPKATPAVSADMALRRMQEDLAYDLRDRQLAETVAAEIAQGVAA